MMLRSDLERMRGCKFTDFDHFVTFIKRFFTYTDVKNEFNIPKDKNTKVINFYGITNTLGMPNRGPIIQTEYKKKYFRRDILKYAFYFNTKYQYEHWNHVLNPSVDVISKAKVSIGPNIFLNNNLPYWCSGKRVVADSLWMKEYVIEKYSIDEKLISVIPIFVSEDFYETMPEKQDTFTIGVVGYYQNDDVKNFKSLVRLCKIFPDIKFEILSSRNRDQFPNTLTSLHNLHFYNIPHDKIHHQMKTWDGYLGLSKRERGPATIQELKVLGIPTICANHTGYKEFNPMFAMDVEPFEEHSYKDIDLFADAIKELRANDDKYREQALLIKEDFWNNEKSTKHVSKLWEDHFDKCIGEK